MNQPPQGYGPPQGYAPQPGYGPPMGYPPPKQGMSTAAKVLIALALLTVMFFGGCFLLFAAGVKGAADQKTKEKKEYDDQTAIKTTVSELIDDYNKNQVAGDQKYKGKKLEVSGTVADIHSGIGDEPAVMLAGKNAFSSVLAGGISKDQAAKLSKGDKVTVVCKCGGIVIGDPVLEECAVK